MLIVSPSAKGRVSNPADGQALDGNNDSRGRVGGEWKSPSPRRPGCVGSANSGQDSIHYRSRELAYDVLWDSPEDDRSSLEGDDKERADLESYIVNEVQHYQMSSVTINDYQIVNDDYTACAFDFFGTAEYVKELKFS